MKIWQIGMLAALLVLVVCVLLGALSLAMPLIIGPPNPTARPTFTPTPVHRGPAPIEFGSAIDESAKAISVRGTTSHFPDPTSGNDIAWLTFLDTPVGTTRPELVISMTTGPAGGEVVVASNPIQLADPTFDVVYGTLSPALYFTPGTYTLRLMSGDSILAQGQFDVP